MSSPGRPKANTAVHDGTTARRHDSHQRSVWCEGIFESAVQRAATPVGSSLAQSASYGNHALIPRGSVVRYSGDAPS